jgi:hypothetical protein
MIPTKPIRPDDLPASPTPKPASDAVSREGTEEQAADVGSDRSVADSPAKNAPLEINEIEDLENDAEGG